MKIGMITSYLPLHCGIATYSSYLIEELRKLGHRVFIVCHKGGEGLDCYPVFNYDDPDLAYKAFKTMLKLNPEVVHIQHEYGLFGDQRGMSAIPLAFKFKLSNIPTVITLHTVLPECNYQERIIEKALVEVAEVIIVHEQYQKELIKSRVGIEDKVWVIPHGVRTIEPIPKAKEKLNFKGQKIVLLLGYFRRSKNFERVVRIFPQVAEAVKDSLLLIASGARRPQDIHYQEEFLELVARSRVRDRIKIILGPFSQQKFDLILSAADLVVLPYRKGAQSGIMAHCHAMA
ncbi:MAG: glycosyltransferase [Candidatus Aminicenantales bacterium]